MKEFDANGDGEIDRTEFKAMMMKLLKSPRLWILLNECAVRKFTKYRKSLTKRITSIPPYNTHNNISFSTSYFTYKNI